MKNKFLDKINQFFASISDREIATMAIFFPIAYVVELVLSRVQNQEDSIKSVIGFWIILVALRFPSLYVVSLFMAALSFIFTGGIQIFKTDRFVEIGPLAGFGFLLIAIIQMTTLEWKKKKSHDQV
ncbi:MAG: hypothetical protein UT11_C0014G0008 [Berkelbacteria bacterium GW2011_GWA2_38_9]|uniref:Uncharacterized protein n=1 Tax=Berkelbacteria bacterium GW2011_GWA2_38_9 TaxID=1618334 RepID=A0A0G0NVY4_9BACT|nr:MAG: hypothetical protein UT11_C0014G0008 [Berkelbacteria bacterium GW2011_GWA2_38_9]